MNRQAPMWLTVLVSIGAVITTLVADRVAVASQVSAVIVRVDSLEANYKDMQHGHTTILDKLDTMRTQIDSNGMKLQQIEDRQDEVRRKLGIVR